MRYFIKRAIALILSVTLTTAVMSSVVVSLAEAANEYSIIFKNAADKVTTTIVEGSAIHIESKLPPGHRFSTTPFTIVGGSGLFDMAEYSNNTHSLTAKAGSAGGGSVDPKRDSSATYILKPNLYADISDTEGTASMTVMGISGDITSRAVGINIKRSASAQIIESSHFRLTVKENESNNPLIPLSFQPLAQGDVSGFFKDYADVAPVDVGSTRGTDGLRTVKIKLGEREGGANYTFEIKLDKDDRIQIGTTFDIYYDLQAVNSLTLTVITPREVLKRVQEAINTAPTSPNVADGTNAYVNTTDTLSAIRSHFSLLQQVAIYNDPVEAKLSPRVAVDWEWVPKDAAYKGAISLGNETSKLRSVTVIPQLQQVEGNLVATPKYNLGGNQWLSINEITGLAKPSVAITVLGQGSLPKLVPVYKMQPALVNDPTDPEDGQYRPVRIPLVSMPDMLDVYTRNQLSKAVEVGTQLEFGKDLGRAEKVVITSSNSNVLDTYLDNSNIPYSYGSDFLNKSLTAGVVPVKFVPKASGDVTLTFTYYFKDATNKLVPSKDTTKVKFQIGNSTPLDYAEFSNIGILLDTTNADLAAVYPTGELTYGFDTDKTMYNISLPNKVTEFTVAPQIPYNKGVKSIVGYRIESVTTPSAGTVDLNDIDATKRVFKVDNYPLGDPFVVTLTATAQSGAKRDYSLTFTRQRPETNSALASFSIKDEKSAELLNNFVPTTYTYNIEVPYSTRWVKPTGKTASLWASPIAYDPALIDQTTSGLDKVWLKLTYPTDPQPGFDGSKTTVLKTEVTAEDKSKSTYTFNITRKDPSTNDRASALVIKDKAGKVIAFVNDAKFDKDTRQYELRIPYSLKEMTVEVTVEDTAAIKAELKTPKVTKELVTNTTGKPLVFRLEEADLPPPTDKTFDMTVGVYPESGAAPVPYTIKVTRNDPDNDNYLSVLKLQDQDKNPITTFSFNPLTPDYIIPIPFKAEMVTITPTARSPLASVSIVVDNGAEIILDQYTTAHVVTMKPGETKTVLVRVRPENQSADPPYREYQLVLTRAQPSTDARLVSLKVNGGEEFTPTFDPNKTAYSVTMPEGTTSITITAEPKDKAATLLINGEGVVSGQPSNAITPLEAVSTVPVVVTAEDGKTTMTYNIKVTNRNLIPKSTNADLKLLTVNYGDMSPKFKPSITEYEVAVKNDTASVDILPVPAIVGSTVEVFKGTRKLGDYSSNYSSKLDDGENEFSVKITAEEGKITKTYNIIVYRKDEELQGKYKPITTDMVDYKKDGDIVVDITKYPIVSAEVFNTLKTKYPEKNMIFEGNDYSLTIKGKDLDKLIPHEELFDFSLTFSSPLEDEVWDAILNDYRNSKVDPVFIHFNHHGALPAPMVLTLSMGRQYRNLSATWNYYNEERERIDFYGGIKTNSRGTFSVRLTHMSTYVFSDHQIVGAENKSGGANGGVAGGITSGIDGNKLNPNTGAQ